MEFMSLLQYTGVSPGKADFTNVSYKGNEDREDGVVDSLKVLLHEKSIKPWSQEHELTTLSTNAFKCIVPFSSFTVIQLRI